MYFLYKAHHSLLELWNSRQHCTWHFRTILNSEIANKRHENLKNVAPEQTAKGTLVFSVRAETRRQCVTLLNLAWDLSAAAAKSLQLCPILCDPMDGSPPGSPVPGILQTRALEWVAISFSNAWKWKVKVKSLSHAGLCATPWTAAYQAPLSMDFPGKTESKALPTSSHWMFFLF